MATEYPIALSIAQMEQATLWANGNGDLSSVDNTSDLAKPISTATQTALNGKIDDVVAGSNITIDKTDPNNPIIASTGGGVATFTALTDTPANYTGQAGKLVKVDPTGAFLIFGDPSGTTVSWGDINGTLSAQTDLQNALNAKVDDGQVLTDVPAGALFTDTVYNDTAIQAEVDLNTAKVTNVAHPLVETAVPVGAVFTDTVYDPATKGALSSTTYGADGLTQGTIDGVLYDFTYAAGKLATAVGGGVTKTYTWSGDNLTSVVIT